MYKKLNVKSFGNHDKAALLIVIVMSYTHTFKHSYTKLSAKLFAKLWTLLTHHIFVHTFAWIYKYLCRARRKKEKTHSVVLHLMNLNTQNLTLNCAHNEKLCVWVCVFLGFPLDWRGKFRYMYTFPVGVSWFMHFVFHSLFTVK